MIGLWPYGSDAIFAGAVLSPLKLEGQEWED